MDWEGCPKASPIQHNTTLPLSFPLMSLDSLTAQLQGAILDNWVPPCQFFFIRQDCSLPSKKDAGAKQSQSYLIHFYTDVYLRRYARSSPHTMFFVEVGLISFTFTLTSIQVGMLAPLVVGPGGLFLNAGVCGCACTPPALRWVWGIVCCGASVCSLQPAVVSKSKLVSCFIFPLTSTHRIARSFQSGVEDLY